MPPRRPRRPPPAPPRRRRARRRTSRPTPRASSRSARTSPPTRRTSRTTTRPAARASRARWPTRWPRSSGSSRPTSRGRSIPFNSSYAPGEKKFDFDINQISITPQRQKRVDFSDPYFEAPQAVIAPAGSPGVERDVAGRAGEREDRRAGRHDVAGRGERDDQAEDAAGGVQRLQRHRARAEGQARSTRSSSTCRPPSTWSARRSRTRRSSASSRRRAGTSGACCWPRAPQLTDVREPGARQAARRRASWSSCSASGWAARRRRRCPDPPGRARGGAAPARAAGHADRDRLDGRAARPAGRRDPDQQGLADGHARRSSPGSRCKTSFPEVLRGLLARREAVRGRRDRRADRRAGDRARRACRPRPRSRPCACSAPCSSTSCAACRRSSSST